MDTVQEVEAKAISKRDAMYQIRFNEIERGMVGDEPGTNERILDKCEQLSHPGYIWQVGRYGYEPGIPSLMSFVRDIRCPKPGGKRPARLNRATRWRWMVGSRSGVKTGRKDQDTGIKR